ncbi:MAG: hypothetical protein ABJA71_03095 [Ginsengibacter sp.]
MHRNEKYSVPPFFSNSDEEIKKAFNVLQEKNDRLQLENDQLKRELEREQILHKHLYNEWKGLKSGEIVKNNGLRKIKRFVRKRPSFYGLFASAILLSALIVYLAFSSGTDTISSQIPAPATNLADTAARDTTSKKIQGLSNKSPIAKPTIRLKQKKSATYSVNQDGNPTYQNGSVTKNGSKKIDSALPVN